MRTSNRKLLGCLVVAAAGFVWSQAAAQERGGRGPGGTEVRGAVKSVDATGMKITIAVPPGRDEGRDAPHKETTFSLAKDVEVAVGSSFGRGASVFREGKLNQLLPGTMVSLTLTADKKTVDSILAEEPTVHGKIKSVDAGKNTITVLSGGGRGSREQPQDGEEHTYTVDKDAEIVVDEGRGRFFAVKEIKLADLAEGALVTMRLSLDKKSVHNILAEGPTIAGTIKELDAGKKTFTLVVRAPRGDDAGETVTVNVPEGTLILLDDGRGRRLSIKAGKLADVPVGAAAVVRLTPDQQFATTVRVQGPTLAGVLKSVDAAKGNITIAIPRGRGEDPEEKSLNLAKNIRTIIDGREANLADLKITEDGPAVQLRMSLDQKTVQAIMTSTGGGRR